MAQVQHRVQARDGELVELFGDMSLRECTLVVSGMATTDPDLELDCVTLELQLDRPDVLELRDMLDRWLARGQL